MTPSEFSLIVDVFQEKQKEEAEKDLLTAYMTAYFHRIEKLEPFETYRSKLYNAEQDEKASSNEDLLQKVLQLHEKMNGTKGG
jgi:hypothetical protein